MSTERQEHVDNTLSWIPLSVTTPTDRALVAIAYALLDVADAIRAGKDQS